MTFTTRLIQTMGWLVLMPVLVVVALPVVFGTWVVLWVLEQPCGSCWKAGGG